MRALVFGACAALCVVTNSPAQQSPDSGRRGAIPLEGVETNPDWVRKPSGDEVDAVYPPYAAQIHAGGHVVLNCEVKVDGSLQACGVESEEPVGLGFGGAAMKLTGSFSMKPRRIDGVAAGGAKVNIPIAFAMFEPPAPPEPQGPAPGGKEVDLARRLLIAQNYDQEIRRQIDNAAAEFKRQKIVSDPSLAHDSKFDAGIVAAKVSAYAQIPKFIEDLARINAQSVSDDQLTAVVAFYESPVGRAWSARQPSIRTQSSRLDLEFSRTLNVSLCGVSSCAN